jgi:ABC-type lipoprotein release transport system permease subunit
MAVLIRLRAELRSSWPSWAGYVVLVGLIGALVIATAAVARRTETVLPRAIKWANLTDVGMPVGSKLGFADLKQEDVARLPEVENVYRSDGFFADPRTEKGRPLSNVADLSASPDPRLIRTVNRLTIIHGRALDPSHVHEAVVDEFAADENRLRVGDTFTARFASASQLDEVLRASEGGAGALRLRGPRFRFRVVGIAASFEATSADAGFRTIQLSAAFDHAYASRLARTTGFVISLKHGEADIPAFKRSVERLAKGERTNFFSISDFGEQAGRTTHVQAVALWVLAVLGAFVGLLVLAQALARQAQLESADNPTLRALGMSRPQLLVLTLARTAAIGLAGAVLAAAGAIALSPLGPVGAVARKAEPNPGVHADVLVIGLGVASIVVLLLAVTALPAWRAARAAASPAGTAADEHGGKPTVADRLARNGLTPAGVAGVRMALEPGRGRTAVPVRTAIAGVALALATIAAALTFAASLNRLTTTPRLYGQNWDAQFGGGDGSDKAAKAFPLLEHPTVAAFSAGTSDEVSIDGERVGVIAMDRERGSIAPSVIDGRPPAAPNEVMLATKTLDSLGAKVGQVVTIRVGDRSSRARIVGRGVIPDFTTTIVLGKGAFMTFAGYKRLVPRAPRNTFLVRFAPRVDKPVAIARLRKADEASFGARPTDLANFDRVDSMPFVIGGVLGTAAIATLVHTLLITIRRRRRELAILKTLGFERGQVFRAVAWQATTVAVIAAVFGIPLGIAGGRWIWTLTADGLGVVRETVVPVVPTLLVVPLALIVAILVAAVPARVAARTQPGLVLRAE